MSCNDIHHGKNKYSNIYNDAIPLLHKFNDFCDKHKPDLVIELGIEYMTQHTKQILN